MMTREDNETLTRTGPGTPMGNLFRNYWMPVLLSAELPDPDGPQVRVKVLGEALLAFRDSDGRVGLVEPRCPHRGADLFFGRNEEGGIRCAYHGWKFDVHGHCLDIPILAPEVASRMCEKARITSYPVREWGGFVWAYLGPRDVPPGMPQMEFALVPPSHRHVARKFQECNWAQAAEGAVDTAHFSFLHQPIESPEDRDASLADKARRATRGYSTRTMSPEHVRWMRDDARPQYHVRQHGCGLVLGASRRAGEGEHYWRIAQYLMPNHGYTPSATEGETYHGQTWVPIDDESCWIFVYSWNPARPLTDEEREGYRHGGAVYPQMDERWMPLRNRGNDYLIDRRLQRAENFTGIVGVSEQDAAIQDSQGRIVDRTREMLGATDTGVVQLRRLMLRAADTLAREGTAPGIDDPEAYRVRGGGIVAPAADDFDTVMTRRFGHALGRIGEDA